MSSAGVERTLGPPPPWMTLSAAIIRRLPIGRYRAMHLLPTRAPFLAHAPQLGGVSFSCDLGDQIAREVFVTGGYEPQETALARLLLREGDTFVDVGANWGYFTLMAASLVGPRGRVLALEPDPRMYGELAGNVARNALSWVTPLQIAATATDDSFVLAGYDKGATNRGTSAVGAHASGGLSFRVRGRALAGVLSEERIGRMALLKMDVEGGELDALMGMAGIVAAGQCAALLLELHPHALASRGQAMQQVVAMLEKAGYRGWSIDHEPEVTRAVAYQAPRTQRASIGQWLSPIHGALRDDGWPHTVWLAPGVEVPW